MGLLHRVVIGDVARFKRYMLPLFQGEIGSIPHYTSPSNAPSQNNSIKTCIYTEARGSLFGSGTVIQARR
jgi:hypothetical protein